MADGSYCMVKDIKAGESVWVWDHYNGGLVKEKIVANVHDASEAKECYVIGLRFEDGTNLEIVKSHVLFDMTDNQYVWIDSENIKNYIGHAFAAFVNGEIAPNKLVDFSVELRNTCYYVPISKFHMNVFAENILTMPPTKLTVNLFKMNENMLYDLTALDEYGVTSYDEIAGLVSAEEYEDLPCKYFSAVLGAKNCTVRDFEKALALYREQGKYRVE